MSPASSIFLLYIRTYKNRTKYDKGHLSKEYIEEIVQKVEKHKAER